MEILTDLNMLLIFIFVAWITMRLYPAYVTSGISSLGVVSHNPAAALYAQQHWSKVATPSSSGSMVLDS